MRLPQRSGPYKATIVAFLLVFTGAAAAEEDLPDDPRQPLFSCGTDLESDRGFLDLSGIEVDFAKWTDLHFERTGNGDGKLLYSFPPKGVDYRTAFLFSHSDGPEGYLVSMHWVDAGTNYVYYSLNIPPDPTVEDDAGGSAAGLVISKDGKLIKRVHCIEAPYMFVSYLRNATSCDMDNPYGPAACEDSSFKRTTPLDVATIGIVP